MASVRSVLGYPNFFVVWRAGDFAGREANEPESLVSWFHFLANHPFHLGVVHPQEIAGCVFGAHGEGGSDFQVCDNGLAHG